MGRDSQAAKLVAAVATEALLADSPAMAMRRVTNALVDVVGADNAIYHEFHLHGWGVLHATAPTDVWEVLPFRGAPTAELRQLHPGVDVMCRARGYRPFALTDIVSERQWCDYEFRDMLRPACGKTLKLHIGVNSPADVARGWSLTRNGSDYSRADLEVAQALQPVLDAVVQRYAAAVAASLKGDGVLTDRELAVLRCSAEGITSAAIARRLQVSPRTVSKHLEHTFRKLDVGDRVSALTRATQLGLLGPDSIPMQRESVSHKPAPVSRHSGPDAPFVQPLF